MLRNILVSNVGTTQSVEQMIITGNDQRYMMVAKNLAYYGEHRVRVGALAVAKGNRVAGTFNTYRNPASNVPHMTATRHAEWNCIKQISPRLLTQVTLYVVRLNLQNTEMPSEPCQYCMEHLSLYGVPKVCFINKQGQLVKIRVE